MVRSSIVECSFLIPVYRDANLSDGRLHLYEAWEWLDDKLFEVFGGRTLAPGLHGFLPRPGYRREGERQVVQVHRRGTPKQPQTATNAVVGGMRSLCSEEYLPEHRRPGRIHRGERK